jgi:hypothetical protein
MSGGGWSHPESGLEETVAAHPAMRRKYPTISSERSVHHHNSGQPGLTLRPHNNNRPVRGRRRHIYAIGEMGKISIVPQSGVTQKEME